jgi:hypothetical protein
MPCSTFSSSNKSDGDWLMVLLADDTCIELSMKKFDGSNTIAPQFYGKTLILAVTVGATVLDGMLYLLGVLLSTYLLDFCR